MSRNPRPISHDVSFLTPSYPKGKAIFELSGFGTIFFCYRINPENRLAPRNSKTRFGAGFCLLIVHFHFPMFGKKTLPAQISSESPGTRLSEKWEDHQRHQKLRLVFDSVFKGYFSDGLPLISVATSDVDASSSGDSDPLAHDSKNLVRQKSRLFPTMFHILPPRTPKEIACLRSAALKRFLLSG